MGTSGWSLRWFGVADAWVDGDGDTVFARRVESLVDRARTRTRVAFRDRDEVFVLSRIAVARIRHDDTVTGAVEFERFVFGAFAHSVRELESRERMWGCLRRNSASPHPVR